jgi:hypothetical protein
MRVSREYKCFSGCCWFAGCCDCCSHELKVESPVGQVIGYVRQSFSFLSAKFEVLDEHRESILKIHAPLCIYDGCFCDTQFKILGTDGESQIGQIRKEYSGFIKEVFTNADNFTITCKSIF